MMAPVHLCVPVSHYSSSMHKLCKSACEGCTGEENKFTQSMFIPFTLFRSQLSLCKTTSFLDVLCVAAQSFIRAKLLLIWHIRALSLVRFGFWLSGHCCSFPSADLPSHHEKNGKQERQIIKSPAILEFHYHFSK